MPKTRAQIVDEFGEIERKMLLWRPPAEHVNPYTARYNELQAEILSWHADSPADEAPVESGKLYQALISARGFKSIVTTATRRAAFSFLEGASISFDPFEIFSVSIADLKAHCGLEFVKQFVGQEQTGPRKISVVAKQPLTTRKKAA